MLTTKRDSPQASRVLVFDGGTQVGTIIKQGLKQFWWCSQFTGGYADSEYEALRKIEATLKRQGT